MQKLRTRIDGPVAVIGDVHGQVEKLLALLDKLRAVPDFEQRWVVFIGDFVDRGPDPKAAVDVVLDLLMQHPRTTAVAGNHEFAMTAALGLIPTPEYANWEKRWTDHYDARTTFESYGAEFDDVQDLAARMPEKHKAFLSNLPWCVEHPRYIFVHAGLDTNAPFEMQMRILRQKDFTLNRPQWLCSKSFVEAAPPPGCPQTVVSGHVYTPKVEFRPKRIQIDTTGGTQGDLSCVLLPEKKVLTSGAHAATEESRSWWKIWGG
jgi:serine/threonine protein phosphatase 1